MASYLDPNRVLTQEPAARRTGPLDVGRFRATAVRGTNLLAFPTEPREPEPTTPSFVNGVSLTSILQMLHLERKTCLLEVAAPGASGTITLVNGELVDAEALGIDGEEAVYRLLAWQRPRVTILDGVTLFRNTVHVPLSQLIVEAVRRQDELSWPQETGRPALLASGEFPAATPGQTSLLHSDWVWLVETLILSGALVAAVVRSTDERVLARATERRIERGDEADAVEVQFASLLRSASHWSRQSFPVIEEVALRMGERLALICPLGRDRSAYACALFERGATLEFALGAIRALSR